MVVQGRNQNVMNTSGLAADHGLSSLSYYNRDKKLPFLQGIKNTAERMHANQLN